MILGIGFLSSVCTVSFVLVLDLSSCSGVALCTLTVVKASSSKSLSSAWYVGKTKMKDWKAAVRTWEKNQRQKNKKSKDDEGLEGWLNA